MSDENLIYDDWLKLAAGAGLGLNGAKNLTKFYTDTTTRLTALEGGEVGANGIADITSADFAGGAQSFTGGNPSASLMNQNREAIKAAIVHLNSIGGGTLLFPPGRYPINREPNQLYNILFQNVSNIRVYGYGATVAQAGDTGGTSADLYGFYVLNCTNLRFEGLTFSQRDLTSAGEQVHWIQLGGVGNTLSDDIHIVACRFVEEPTAGGGGDGIRLLGHVGLVSRVNIDRCLFDNCHRSGIGVQYGTEDIKITKCFFARINDQCIDFEVTSTESVRGFYIAGNTFLGAGANVVTLSGNGDTRHRKSYFVNNTIINGTVSGLNVGQLVIAGNIIEHEGVGVSEAPLGFFRRADDIFVVNNYIRMGNAGAAAPVISFEHNGGYYPNNIFVRGNRIIQESSSKAGVYLAGVQNSDVSDNFISYINATADSGANGFIGVQALSQGTRASGKISGNRIWGEAGAGRGYAGVYVAPDSVAEIGQWIIKDNRFGGMKNDIHVPATYAQCVEGPPVISSNQHSGAAGDIAGLDVWAPGGNGGALGASAYTGSIAPEGAITAAQGSTYVRRNGDTSSLWFKQTGVSNTGWVQITVP